MPNTKIYKCLKRLVTSPVCLTQDSSIYAEELKNLAQRVADVSQARRESKFFKSLADENRIRIIKLLMLREMCVCEIKIALNLTQPTTSHHLGILEKEGIIRKRKVARWSYYSIRNKKVLRGLKNIGLLKIKE
ncbi:MAG: ArsR/SmtB family transcription factor [Candidatus Bathycorpusculaceae bacterium]